MTLNTTLTASLEDYLEVIFHIASAKQAVKPRDIAKRMQVSFASVTGALRSLAEKQLINYAPYDLITLTPTGEEMAKDVVRRHEVLHDFFVNVLAVDDEEAGNAACLMEHSIPKTIVDRFILFLEFVQTYPAGGSDWIERFKQQCGDGAEPTKGLTAIASRIEKDGRRSEPVSLKSAAALKLKKLLPGEKAKILKISGRSALNKRILDMGVTPGAVVEIERIAPLGDPIDIKVRGYHLSLRKEETDGIEVERI